MIRLTILLSVLAAIYGVSNSAVTQAGLPSCGCSYAAVQHAPAMYLEPEIDACCVCAAAVPSCCGFGGVGGGMVQLGGLYGSAGFHNHSLSGGYGHSFGRANHRSPDPRSFESGFESLPNMDGGGVHHRLPFHSYRRPWAHPGLADNNINIVW